MTVMKSAVKPDIDKKHQMLSILATTDDFFSCSRILICDTLYFPVLKISERVNMPYEQSNTIYGK